MTTKPPYPSLTPTWHNDIYPAIDYSNPSLSQQGKTIVIIGAGSGIGRESALGFAAAGAKHVVLVGRNEAKLQEVESAIATLSKDTKVSVHRADATDEAAIKSVAEAVGSWNAVLHCAGYMNKPGMAVTADLDDYWKSFEVNLKSALIVAKSFLPTADSTHAAFLTYIGGSVVFPTQMLVGLSGYLVAKLALAKTIEFLALENPHVSFLAVHPGMVDTDLFRASGATPDMLAMDTPKLSAGFSLWAALPEAKFLSGKFIWANWDVEELKNLKEEISGNKLTFGVEGWPFPHVG
jgi:NAD(P)-dependent dehydrogenase (short-subunit alcohol dehydrogenase family)